MQPAWHTCAARLPSCFWPPLHLQLLGSAHGAAALWVASRIGSGRGFKVAMRGEPQIARGGGGARPKRSVRESSLKEACDAWRVIN